MNTKLSDTVIPGGFCIGCGACAVADDSNYKVVRTRFGLQEAQFIQGLDQRRALEFEPERVCPFSNASRNEDELSDIFYPDAPRKSNYIGRHWATYAGSVADDQLRARASSGGVGRWLSRTLLKKGLVDYVVHVVPTPNNEGKPLFGYSIVSEFNDVVQAARSAYYPTPMAEVLKQMRQMEGRFLVTGVPCYAKALKSLCLEDPLLADRIKYVIGIVCGHMKSESYAELIAWQMGVLPEELEQIDFRGKVDGVRASSKQNIVTSGSGEYKEFSKNLFGTGYGLGLFKPKACDFCDDVLAEAADVSIGDAWLPEYVQDSRGSSIVVVRNRKLGEIIKEGMDAGELDLDSITANAIVQSQEGGIRHRTDGLECRIKNYGKDMDWIPEKRIKPTWRTRFKNRNGLYDLRYELATRSHAAFFAAKESGSLDEFMKSMEPLIEKQKKLMKKEKKGKKDNKLERFFSKILKKVGKK